MLNIIQAMGKQSINRDIQVNVLTDNMQDVLGEGIRCPERSTLLGAIKVIPLEYSNIKCRCIDIPVPPGENIEEEAFLDTLFNEVVSNFPGAGEAVVALRGNHRWIRSFKPIHLESPGKTCQRLQEKGVYLITGGVGGIGLTLACFLAETVKARIILTGRSAFPTREEWSHWLSTHEENDEVSLKIKKLRELEALGSEVMIANADAADLEQMREVTTAAEKRFGPINGILHAAGIIDYEGVIQRRTRRMTERGIAAKVKGTLVLEALFKHRQLDFFLLFSCVGSLLYHDKFAQVGYIASNAFIETFALYKAGKDRPTPRATAINWPDWLEKGMVMKALDKMHQGNKEKIAADLRRLSPVAVSPAEGTRIFQYILGQPRLYPWIAALPKDLNTMIRQMHTRMDQSPNEFETAEEIPAPEILYQRPELITPYVEPTNDIEKKLTGIFQRFFGIEQVGIDDDFFELGGNSLIAMNILARIHKELNVKIPLVELFNRPTVHGLAPFLEKTGKDNTHPVESSEKKEYYPLSSAQKRLYIICEMDKNSTGYNQPEIVLLEGKLEKAKLEEAFHTLIKRHEMLRTSFCTLNEEPVQIVHDPGEIHFIMDYYQTGETEAKEIIDHYIKPFDLSRLPLFGVLLVKIGEEKHILVLNIHHIISDGPSNLIFFNELMMGYNGEGLPLLKLQYKDFSQWHNSLITSGKIEKQKKYWLNVFSRVLPVLHLPTDYRRPERQTFEGGLISFEISGRESGGLKQLAKDREVTPFMLLLALYAIMLSKISGQPDIVIGTPVSGAKPSDFDGVMGMFVNTLALRIFPHGDKTIGEFLKEVREHTLKAFENQDYQFEELVEQVVTQRDVSRNPLFDVMFVFQNFGTPVVKPTSSSPGTTASGLILKSYEYTVNSTRFDLILQGFEVDGRLYFTLDYRGALFENERIQWFIQYFQDIISTVLQDPGQKISQIGLTTQWETQEILPQLHEDLKNET